MCLLAEEFSNLRPINKDLFIVKGIVIRKILFQLALLLMSVFERFVINLWLFKPKKGNS